MTTTRLDSCYLKFLSGKIFIRDLDFNLELNKNSFLNHDYKCINIIIQLQWEKIVGIYNHNHLDKQLL